MEGVEEEGGEVPVGKAAVIPFCQLLLTAPSESCSGAQCCQNSQGRRGRWYEIIPW